MKQFLGMSLFLIVAAYVGSVMYLANYLRRFHALTWMGLGQSEVERNQGHS
jgi:hypothetical protein